MLEVWVYGFDGILEVSSHSWFAGVLSQRGVGIIYIDGLVTTLLLFFSGLRSISRYPLLEKDSLNAPTK